MREVYKSVEDVKATTINQLASITQLNLLSKKDTLNLMIQFSSRLTVQQELTLLYDIMENVMDVPSYEFSEFCNILFPYLKSEIPYEALLADF